MKFNIGFIVALIFALPLLLTPEKSQAVVTVTIGNASVVDVSTGGAITVYGGVAGDTDRCEGGLSNSAPCNNCTLKQGEGVGGGDALLLACNERRIHTGLQLVITVVSDAIDGIPTITNFDGSSQLTFSGPGTVPKGTVATITLPWSEVCRAIFAIASSGGGSGCSPTLGTATGTLRVGISTPASNGLLNGTGDDQKTISFVIRNVAGNTAGNVPSLAENCDSTSLDSRICYFEVGPGDEKAVVRSLLAPDGSSFPSAETTQFRAVRFLWAEGDFTNINLASAHQDLVVTGSDVATFNVTPRRIEGLTNDRTYYFKNALVDAAGNVGLYSQATNDRDCSENPNPAATDCRIVTPSEVVGVLDETNCFIASAAYGTSFATELDTLRDFRDQILSRTKLGENFIRWYYAKSPSYAKLVLENQTARATVRAALVPVVWFAGFVLAYGPMNAGLAFLASLVVLAGLVSVMRPRKEARRRLLPLILGALLLPGLTTPSPLLAQSVAPLEELQTDDETPPEPEYPYPGAKGSVEPTQIDAPPEFQTELAPEIEPEAAPAVEPRPLKRKPRPRYTGTKPRDPNQSPYEKPKAVNEDGDYIFEKAPELAPRQYAPPKRYKFSKKPGREAPASITMDGEFNYPVKESEFTGAAGLRFGFMSSPNITNSSNGLTFTDIYGKEAVPALLVEYEYPLTRALGRIGLKFETGAYAKQAAGRFKNPARNAELPEEKFTFVMIPLQAMIHYRFQFADSQLFVPFIEGGAAYNGIVELRDDNKTPRFGGAPAVIAGAGVNILLDWIDKRSIRQLDAEYGINHVWFTAQYRQTVGLKKDLDISSNLISAGFTFDY